MPCVPRSLSLVALTLFCGSTLAFAQVSVPSGLMIASNNTVAYSGSNESTGELSSAAAQSNGRVVNHATKPFSTVGIGVSVSTLGIGFQVATPVAQKLNIRGGGDFFSYNSGSYTGDGITYQGTLKLRSGEALLDWFPVGGFHLSPGVMFYNGFDGLANLHVPAGQNFTLNNTQYASSNASPVTGTAEVTANKVAPMFLLGFGNLVPRNRHFSGSMEFGFAYQGDVKVSLAFAGNACNPSTQVNCRNMATDPGIQANVNAQKTTIINDVQPYARFYPIFRIGFGYKF